MKAYFYDTKIGSIKIAEENGQIVGIHFGKDKNDCEICEAPLIKEAAKQLCEYLDGHLQNFDLPLAPKGTDFQQKVWKTLQAIPYGETASYKEIAIRIGNPKACRAVGMANNKNPIAIVIPCHRVIGANGKMVGYAGGLNIKENLLELESKN